MKAGSATFIRDWTKLEAHPFVPEILIHQAKEITPLWQAVEAWAQMGDLPPPFWAFVWPGGAALARYLLDHPDEVAGKRVLDFASGSGIGAIAAAKAGAKAVLAADIDPLAQVAAQMNAARNGVVVENVRGVDLTEAWEGVDLIIAGDVCYEQAMSIRVLRWLHLCADAGTAVILADPGRAYAPQEGGEPFARTSVPVTRELEDRDVRDVALWRL